MSTGTIVSIADAWMAVEDCKAEARLRTLGPPDKLALLRLAARS